MIVKNEKLLAEFRAEPCEWCGKPAPSDPHHLKKRGMGGGNRLDIRWNIVALCRGLAGCHEKAERNEIDRNELLALVLDRELNRLSRLPKETIYEPGT